MLASALHRTRIEDPAVTRARLRPRLGEYGITRVANVTGLDRLGLPVYMAVRPNSCSLSVSQGKGPTHDAAWVSAAMEAIELWHAENPGVELVLASIADLSKRARVVDIERLPRRSGAPLDAHYRIAWTRAVDLLTDEPIYVPYALVHVNSVAPFPPGDESFHVTSNGLASGSAWSEAIVHGLCEVIERDAVNRWRRGTPIERAEHWIDLSTIDADHVAELVGRCHDAGFAVLAGYAPSPVGVPVTVAVLLDRWDDSGTLRGASMGFGCHPRRDIALLRALTEAAQSRLTLIAGSRDDLERSDYEVRRRHQEGLAAYRAAIDSVHPLDFTSLPTVDHSDLDGQVGALLTALHRAGVPHVAAVTLADREGGPSVIRVVAPGLLGPAHVH